MSFSETLWYKESRPNRNGGETTISMPIKFDLDGEVAGLKRGEALAEEFFKDYPAGKVTKTEKKGLWPF